VWCAFVASAAAVQAQPEAQTSTQSAAASIQAECAVTGLFLVDLDAKKVTVVPARLEVEYTEVAPNEICFAWFVVKGTKDKQVKKFKLKDFGDLKGVNNKSVLKEKKVQAGELDLISLSFDDKPKWDADGDGHDELLFVKEAYAGEFTYDTETFTVDPDIIITRPGG
jgi:hypothetical protein